MLNRTAILLCFVLSSCAGFSDSTRKNVSGVIDIATCTAKDITPDAISAFNVISSGSASDADKIVTGILSGTSAISKALACYMASSATVRAQSAVSGELASAKRTDKEIMQARAEPCDIASQGYDMQICMSDRKKIAAFLVLSQARKGLISIGE